MRKQKRYKTQAWVREMDPAKLEALMQECYQQAVRVGSIRAIEDCRQLGRNRLYRWVHKRGLPTIRRRTKGVQS